jgi:thiol-disulfide isomerase/thioredoxin
MCTFSFTQIKGDSLFELSGKIIGFKYPFVYLEYQNIAGKDIRDSCQVQKDSFYFKGYIAEPTFAILLNDTSITDLYLEAAQMTVSVAYNNFKAMHVTGSKNNDAYDSLKMKFNAIDRNSDSVDQTFNKVRTEFIISNPDLFISARELAYYDRSWSLQKVKSLYDNFSDNVKNSRSGKEIKKAITEIEDNSPGKKAKQFSITDMDGRKLNLSDFKNGYLLLDFWASWCEPCRESTPKIIMLYKQYHQKGLNIIGVSVDDKVENWKLAVAKDSISIWHNVLSKAEPRETEGHESINQLYRVFVYPTLILINKKGVIIGRYTGTENEAEFVMKLESLFKKNDPS